MATCPAGHTTTAEDYCDVCGMPVGAGDAPAAGAGGGSAPAPTLGGAGQACPHCDAPNAVDALFCEVCGYDFTTGSMPRPLTPPDPVGTAPGSSPLPAAPAPAPDPRPGAPAEQTVVSGTPVAVDADVDWVVEVWIDPAWYAEQESPDPLPSAGLPVVRPLRGRSLLVGRTSQSRNIHPDVDCESDTGVSRRQCQLTSDGTRWWVEDLGSANGTFVGRASGALPQDPVAAGVRQELRPDDRVYVGAWTRLVIRAATEEERGTLG